MTADIRFVAQKLKYGLLHPLLFDNNVVAIPAGADLPDGYEETRVVSGGPEPERAKECHNCPMLTAQFQCRAGPAFIRDLCALRPKAKPCDHLNGVRDPSRNDGGVGGIVRVSLGTKPDYTFKHCPDCGVEL